MYNKCNKKIKEFIEGFKNLLEEHNIDLECLDFSIIQQIINVYNENIEKIINNYNNFNNFNTHLLNNKQDIDNLYNYQQPIYNYPIENYKSKEGTVLIPIDNERSYYLKNKKNLSNKTIIASPIKYSSNKTIIASPIKYPSNKTIIASSVKYPSNKTIIASPVKYFSNKANITYPFDGNPNISSPVKYPSKKTNITYPFDGNPNISSPVKYPSKKTNISSKNLKKYKTL